MKIFCCKNLMDRTMKECLPWEFKPEQDQLPTAQIRADKDSRQDWYRTLSTVWNFYTFLEGANPNQRIGKDNPARLLHGLAADYDVKLPLARSLEAVDSMTIKPQWIETSVGGNARLVWIFPFPVNVDDEGFLRFLLQEGVSWLRLGLLPALDEPAFTEPTRLLCNGAVWHPTNCPVMPEATLQAFIVECGRKYRFNAVEASSMPLDEVEKKIIEKFPGFSWPGEFVIDSQGPSFWVPNSQSPLSAIVKKDGMFTFSAHADKPFYPWADIIGSQVIKQFTDGAITMATKDVWFDKKHFWRRKNGRYVQCEKPEMDNFLKVSCRLSSKPDKTGISMCDMAFNHIYNNEIAGAAPFVFRPYGILHFQGNRVLNIYVNRVVKPADLSNEPAVVWGDPRCAFLCRVFDNLFDPPEQLKYFLAWFKYFYESGLNETPLPGQAVFLMGGAGVGKTLVNREIVGRAVGGFVDAAEHLTRRNSFDSSLYEVPLWCVDDETMAESSQSQANFQAMLKKTTANAEFMSRKKYAVDTMTVWHGRALCTTNLDYVSSRALGSLDNTSQDKISVFRCAEISKMEFPSRLEIPKIIEAQLPYFLSWLHNWTPPEEVKRDSRYGYYRHHEPTLLVQAYQSSKVAPFKEILVEVLLAYFKTNPQATEWRGPTTALIREMYAGGPMNDRILQPLKLEQITRYLEMLQRERMIDITSEDGDYQTRIWIFKRFGPAAIPAPQPPEGNQSEPGQPNQFQK
jgi:hypothetical protein